MQGIQLRFGPKRERLTDTVESSNSIEGRRRSITLHAHPEMCALRKYSPLRDSLRQSLTPNTPVATEGRALLSLKSAILRKVDNVGNGRGPVEINEHAPAAGESLPCESGRWSRSGIQSCPQLILQCCELRTIAHLGQSKCHTEGSNTAWIVLALENRSLDGTASQAIPDASAFKCPVCNTDAHLDGLGRITMTSRLRNGLGPPASATSMPRMILECGVRRVHTAVCGKLARNGVLPVIQIERCTPHSCKSLQLLLLQRRSVR
mmetsp:Transcript_8032/g.25028  ORF Transcript_8032/g.25028 Transcript_8032/m.25028 type:complete len:263 (+) Transcript_8032:1315-2103(+)